MNTAARIVAIWRELFGRDDVQAGDEFIALGGHSMLAIRVAARIKQDLGVDVRVRDVLRHSTPERLADVIDRNHAEGGR